MIQLEIWSDIVCPWCYIGKRRMERALATLDEEVHITWKSFELDPHSTSSRDISLTEMLAKKYGMTLARAKQMQDQVTAAAAAEGLDFVFDEAKPANTFDAHRLLHLAHAHQLGDALKERLMRAYFTQGLAIGERETLATLAIEVGLPEERVREVLEKNEFAQAVRNDEQRAKQLGIQGVPFFVVNGTHGISGAQTPEVFAEVFAQARGAATSDSAATASGEQCDEEGCEVPG